MTDRSDRPLLIHAANPGPFTGRGNNTWLLDGAEPTLIDAGTGEPAHLEALAAALAGRALVRVLVTHGHRDHASGREALVARWPSLECWKWPDAGDAPGAWRPLTDSQRIVAGDRRLDVLHTPGHAPDHVCFVDDPARAVYGGDLLIEGASVLIPAGRGGSLRAYLDSLARVEADAPRVVYPGHGRVIEDPRAVIAEHRRHREAREVQVLACAAETGPDVEAIVARLYPALDEPLLKAARMTVQAHLDKLREDGRLP